jgi:hypothetical protein
VFGGVGGDPSVYTKSAWTRNGHPIPFLGAESPYHGDPSKAPPMRQLFEQMISDPAAVARATIPVEKSAGPVLLASGDDDQLWPSVELSEIAMRRLAGHRWPCVHLRNPGAGHMLSLPHLPMTTRRMFQPMAQMMITFGGTAAADAAASVTTWQATLAFLREHLPPARG